MTLHNLTLLLQGPDYTVTTPPPLNRKLREDTSILNPVKGD